MADLSALDLALAEVVLLGERCKLLAEDALTVAEQHGPALDDRWQRILRHLGNRARLSALEVAEAALRISETAKAPICPAVRHGNVKRQGLTEIRRFGCTLNFGHDGAHDFELDEVKR